MISGTKALTFGFVLLTCSAAGAQDYPNRSINVVVPFPAGGPSDVVARIVTEHMSRTLGQTLVIENVGGAGGTLGSGRVAAAAPDGYTLLAGSMGSHVAAPVLTPNLKYDAKEFVPIGPTAHSPAVIVARKDFPAKDLKEFVADVADSDDCGQAIRLKAATRSDRRRPPFLMKATGLHCQQDDLGQGLLAASRLAVLAVIFRMLSPRITRRCALWTSRSRTASAMVGSAITSCQ